VRPLQLLQALALVAVPVASLAAQGREAPESPSGRRIVPCVGQPIEQIVIYAEAPSVASLRRVPIVAKIAQTMHVTTQPDVIDRFLLFRTGERCSELRRAESERILRAQPFISDADVFMVANENGTVDAEIRTSADLVAAIRGRKGVAWVNPKAERG